MNDDDDDVNWAEATSWLGLTHISRRKRESDILISDLVEWNTLKLLSLRNFEDLKMRRVRFHRYMGFVSKWIKMGCAPNQLVDYIFAMKNYHKLGPNIISSWWYLAWSSISPWYPHNILRKWLERVCFLINNHKNGSRGKCYFAQKKSRGAPKARDGDRQWRLGKSCPRSNPQAHFAILDLNMEGFTQNVAGKRSAKRIDRGSEPPKTIQNNENWRFYWSKNGDVTHEPANIWVSTFNDEHRKFGYKAW